MPISALYRGNPRNPPVIFLHGFLGFKEDWNPFFPFFEKNYYCIAYDLPGHGASPYSENILSVFEEELFKLEERPILVGYSLGGRISLLLKNLTSKLIILSGHPGLKTKEEKEKRKESDAQWSEKLLSLPFQDFLKQWYEQSVFRKQSESLFSSRMKGAQQNTKSLAQVLLQMSLSHQDYFLPCDSPALFLYGEYDWKYREIYNTLPKTILVREVPGCSHAIHLENPRVCSEIILNWLEKDGNNGRNKNCSLE